MNIELRKFGTTLTSRQAGREAFSAFQPTLKEIKTGEEILIDFADVITFSPSWGDEFLSPLVKQFPGNLTLINTTNTSVQATLRLLANINNQKFKIAS